ncbi:MAG: GNAT family N-acetyltransferase [Myxococcales bacterium]|nr:GNAT family N-acetyltransferase [Myxococcota bacterium]MDW8282636.1 GNAT family N-acetyltransferase [Myxococcales bacterium]
MSLPHDRADLVAEEKLFGGDGVRSGQTIGAFVGDPGPGAELAGLLCQAGRWIKLLCVAPAYRRQGLGTLLVDRARAWARPLRIFDHPGNYLSPGLDVRYEEGHAFLRARGFRPVGRIENLRAPLLDNPLVTPARAKWLIEAAARRGYTVRRVDSSNDAEVQAVLDLVGTHFSPVWALEVARALGRQGGLELPEGPGVHAAFVRNGEPVAFAAHDGNNRGLGWFGPMGTHIQHRGQGLGEVLLLACLLDVVSRPEGGVIAWVGPVDFYRRACGAAVDRQFVVYEEG